MTIEHDRSGALVKGHWRNGVWIEAHYRSGTTVSEFENEHRSWSIRDKGQALTHMTECWWCGEAVFFYRDINGGCVLFDELGSPWPIHSCWENHRRQKSITSAIESIEDEVASLGYNGRFLRLKGPRLKKPLEDELQITVTGYIVDNHLDYDKEVMCLSASRRSTTLPLIKLEVSDGNNIYPFLIPKNCADSYPDYSFIDIRGAWIKKFKKWILLGTAIRNIEPFANKDRFYKLINAKKICWWCGRDIESHVIWGLDDKGFQECAYCGEMRGRIPHTEFIKHIRTIARVNK